MKRLLNGSRVIDGDAMQGPNVKKLIAHKMSVDAIPDGGGLADGIKFLSDKTRIIEGCKAATTWVTGAIALVRTAAEPNLWKNADDEVIAGEILKQIDQKRPLNLGLIASSQGASAQPARSR